VSEVGKALSYNLCDSPAILVLNSRGESEELSLRDVFRRAPELNRLVGEVPTVAFVQLRLLLAIMYRALEGPDTVAQWRGWAADWSRVVQAVDEYFEHFEDRFDLYSPARPFMQVAGLSSAKGEVFGLDRIIADVPTGFPYMTTRGGWALERIPHGEAFRWLLHAHAADTSGIKTSMVGDPRGKGGKGYPQGPGWVGQIGGVFLEADTLAQSLLLNLVPLGDFNLVSGDADLPIWERDPLGAGVDESCGGEPRGVIDVYAWQARRVLLKADESGVTGVLIGYGDRPEVRNRQQFEPMTAWRYSERQTKKHGCTVYMPREHRVEVGFWRGLAALLPKAPRRTVKTGQVQVEPPVLLEWAARAQLDGLIPAGSWRVNATGVAYGPQQSTFGEIIHDQIVLPSVVLADDALAVMVQDAIDIAVAVAQVVARLAVNLCEATGGSGDSLDGPREDAYRRAYTLFGRSFGEWIRDADNPLEAGMYLGLWRRTLEREARELGENLIEEAGIQGWRGHHRDGRRIDIGQADAWFHHNLAKVLTHAQSKESASREQETHE